MQEPAGVMELVDVVDSKSTAGDSVPVRVRSPAPYWSASIDTMLAFLFFLPKVACRKAFWHFCK